MLEHQVGHGDVVASHVTERDISALEVVGVDGAFVASG
jgi:hypothetical protein